MKKLIAASLLLATAAAANATDWVELDTNKTMSIYVDADRISYVSEQLNLRSAWVKLKYNKASDGFTVGEYTLANQVFDCPNNRFTVKSVIAYKKNGDVKKMTHKSSGWLDIAPDSNFEYIHNAVCDYPYL